MTIDSVGHFAQQITDIDADSRDRTCVEIKRPQALHQTSGGSGRRALAAARPAASRTPNPIARSRRDRLTDFIASSVAVYLAGGLVASCVVFAAKNVGSERHTWWGWLLIGAPLTWLCFLGMVVLTVGALRAGVGALRWSLSLISRNADAGPGRGCRIAAVPREPAATTVN
jgi:hypothetical protein